MKTINKNLRALVTVFMFTVLGALLTAQPGGQQGPPQVPNEKQVSKMVDDLSKELSLSKDQEAQVSAYYQSHFKTVRAKVSGKQRPERSEMEALDSKLEKDVKATLTADQKKAYTAWLKKQAKKRSNNGPQGGGRPPR